MSNLQERANIGVTPEFASEAIRSGMYTNLERRLMFPIGIADLNEWLREDPPLAINPNLANMGMMIHAQVLKPRERDITDLHFSYLAMMASVRSMMITWHDLEGLGSQQIRGLTKHAIK